MELPFLHVFLLLATQKTSLFFSLAHEVLNYLRYCLLNRNTFFHIFATPTISNYSNLSSITAEILRCLETMNAHINHVVEYNQWLFLYREEYLLLL